MACEIIVSPAHDGGEGVGAGGREGSQAPKAWGVGGVGPLGVRHPQGF